MKYCFDMFPLSPVTECDCKTVRLCQIQFVLEYLYICNNNAHQEFLRLRDQSLVLLFF